MILSGNEIERLVRRGNILIEPFDTESLEVNSYGFHLGDEIIVYNDQVIDPFCNNGFETITLSERGYVLEPNRFYLGHTYERMGGVTVAAELYANASTALSGIFIQTSAPLGHTGAVIRWTLEIVVAQPVRIYPRMRIGKICFWANYGTPAAYQGRYQNSESAVPSRFFFETPIVRELAG